MTANLPNLPNLTNLAKRDQTSDDVIRRIRKYGKTGKYLQLSRNCRQFAARNNASANQRFDGAFRTTLAG
jgi:hypothetical protein